MKQSVLAAGGLLASLAAVVQAGVTVVDLTDPSRPQVSAGDGGSVVVGNGNGAEGGSGSSRETEDMTGGSGSSRGGQTSSGGQTCSGGQTPGQQRATGGRQDFIVMAGGGADIYAPNFLTAEPGSTVTVQFNTGNHTVTEGFAEEACKPLQAKDPNALHSGHIPFSEGQKTVGTFKFSVNDTTCRYYYCATGPHCQRAQIMTINCSGDEFAKYLKKATSSQENIDGLTVNGGSLGNIPLEQADFVPLTAENGAKPPPPPPEPKEPAGGKTGGAAGAIKAGGAAGLTGGAAKNGTAGAGTEAGAETETGTETGTEAETTPKKAGKVKRFPG
ncbi:extracellular serine-rich protein [Ophiocordyceps camponoti-floridani]|uniref:Extracellular serine-rich protein n=1 Tax=Ophiocordyceps camponoti-floridani TaxID=2030778 RepID=A0A8H4Q3V7_9HYPO|nr:extracellular serine-rich protein [Ophiocordyceps camponoti-floridani]